jgi:hypothetical protein
MIKGKPSRHESGLAKLRSDFHERHVRRRVTGQSTAEAGVFEHFDAERVGVKTGSPVESDGAGMIQGASVNEKTVDRLCPGKIDRVIHQMATEALSDLLLHETEEDELAFPALAEIKLEKAGGPAFMMRHIDVDLRISERRVQFLIAHHEA